MQHSPAPESKRLHYLIFITIIKNVDWKSFGTQLLTWWSERSPSACCDLIRILQRHYETWPPHGSDHASQLLPPLQHRPFFPVPPSHSACVYLLLVRPARGAAWPTSQHHQGQQTHQHYHGCCSKISRIHQLHRHHSTPLSQCPSWPSALPAQTSSDFVSYIKKLVAISSDAAAARQACAIALPCHWLQSTCALYIHSRHPFAGSRMLNNPLQKSCIPCINVIYSYLSLSKYIVVHLVN